MVDKYSESAANVIFDVERGTQDNAISICGRKYNYSQNGKKKLMTNCTFYDLLPIGTTVDENSLFITPVTMNVQSYYPSSYQSAATAASTHIDETLYNVEFISDWQGSGRTMMKVDVHIPSSKGAVGADLYYLLHNTYQNVVSNGTTVENDVALVDTTPGHALPDYTSYSYDSNVIKEKQYYQSLEDD